MVTGVLGGALIAGALGGTSCDDNNNSGGVAGTNGFAGVGGRGGGGGTTNANTNVYNMQLTGAQEVPMNPSTATATATVTLDRASGAVTVTGSFVGLSSNAIAAHIHGPAPVGTNAAVLVPLMVPATTSGTVSGTGSMSTVQMDNMINGQTYINIHSTMFPDGEIRAQIVP